MRWIVLLAILAASGCSVQAPDCPTVERPEYAPSAGCFAINQGKLLVVENMEGLVNLPGGSSKEDEAAQCTAFRESWEETGLSLEVGKKLAVMDTGFFLYACQLTPSSGEINPPPRLEISDAYWLEPNQLMAKEWRFPQQLKKLEELLQKPSKAPD